MSELYMMATISDRNQTRRFLAFYKEYGVTVTLLTFGRGTAASEVLDSFGLEAAEKAVLFAFVTDTEWKKIKSGLQKQMKIDIPGSGIAFVVPMSSIGGKKQLQFLTEGRDFEKGEESTLKDTNYELLVVVANQGYTEMIMDAARAAKAPGGTVIHAKGTGAEKAEKFLGVSLATEKEMIFMVAKREGKNAIMKAIMEKAGMESKAKAIVFSLPVTETAGMRLIEETEEDWKP
ncbi:MAG: P-II family nitrogen regulator [Eubacteriales bacterium]|nr:P-II family nitrogen regulator [Eubacteriales bacterium]